MFWFRMTLVLATTAWGVGHAQAQDASAMTRCAAIADQGQRLNCFDSASKAAQTPSVEVNKNNTDVNPSTKEIVATISEANPTSYKTIDPDDLYVSPGKFVGKAIEIKRMRCFHADKDEYRCTAPGSTMLTLFAADIRPASEKEAIETDCGEIKKFVTSPKCVKTVRFVPKLHDQDIVNGYQKRTIVGSPYFEISGSTAEPKRR